jgi:NAD-dependent deacetylase
VNPSIAGQLYDDGMGKGTVEQLAALVRARPPCVALTGAGISTESGIPDFRSPGGIWAQVDPMEVASIDGFLADPAKVWDFYAKRIDALREAQPNDGHRALAELEERGIVRAVITQNVDRLHERAGTRELVEVHGSLRNANCLNCGNVVPFDDVVPLLPVPECPRCGHVLKPGVVMFGELLDPRVMARALAFAVGARLLLVVGSSLEVHPVAGLPAETIAAGGALAIVNRDETPYDDRASVRIAAGAGETLRALADALA